MNETRTGLPDRKIINGGTGSSLNIANSNRYTIRGGNMSSPWDIMSDRTKQGEVTTNMMPNHRMYQARQNNSKDPLGRTTMMDTLTKHEDIDIKENDLILIHKVGRTNGGTITTTPEPFAFSSFTGINTQRATFVTQEAFERSFYLVGQSKIEYRYDGRSHNGISVMVSGATTASNNGMTTFSPGDSIRWSAYSIDDVQRSKQKMVVKKAHGEPVTKLTPMLVRQTHADIFKLPNLALEHYASLSQSERESLLSKKTDDVFSSRTETSKDRMIQAMKTSTILAGLSTVSTLMELGILIFLLPSDPLDSQYQTAGLQEISRINMNDLKSKTFFSDLTDVGDEDKATGGAFPMDITDGVKDNPKIADDIRRRNKQSTIMLAHLLGFIPPTTERGEYSHITPLYNAIDMILKKTYRGIADEPVSSKFRDEASLLNVGDPIGKIEALNSGRLLSALERRLHLAQINAPREELIEFYEAYNAATEQVFAKALNHSQPGSTIDILM